MTRPGVVPRRACATPLCAVVALLTAYGCGQREAPVESSAPTSRAVVGDLAGDRQAPTPAPVERQPVSAQDPLTALRQAVEAELDQLVSIEIDERRSNARWTFVTGVARTPDGKPLDYAQTRFADQVADGTFDDWLCALMERNGGGWQVVALEIGATDVPFVDWPARYGVPSGIVMP